MHPIIYKKNPIKRNMSIAVFHQVNTQCMVYKYKLWLVVSTPLKNMKVSWGYYSENMEKCSKPPTRTDSRFTCIFGSIQYSLVE